LRDPFLCLLHFLILLLSCPLQQTDRSASLPTSNVTPALQLVSEIFESLKVKNVKNDSKKDNEVGNEKGNYMEKNKKTQSMEVQPQTPVAENFEALKSRLKKVSKSVDEKDGEIINDQNNIKRPTNFDQEEPGVSSELNGKEKRSSTGSITNLKRMWESQKNVSEAVTPTGFKPPKSIAKEAGDVNYVVAGGRGSVRSSSDSFGRQEKVSPKSETELENRMKPEEKRANHDVNPKSNVGNSKTDKNKPVKIKRVWPPQSLTNETDKPAVPTKPFVSKKTNPIYATPSQRVDHSSRGKQLI